MISKILSWIGDHKLLTAAGVGIGYLVLAPDTAHANPALPGTKGVTPLPGGGLHVATDTGGVVIPPSHATSQGNGYVVTTSDPAPSGNLNARADNTMTVTPNGLIPSGSILGYFPKNGLVSIIDAGDGNGMVLAEGPGIQGNTAMTLRGWVWSGYLTAQDAIS